MNTLIWIVQIILAIKLITVTFTHGLRQRQPTMQEAMQRMGAGSRLLHGLLSILAFLGCVGLILPSALGIFHGITVGTAGFVFILMLVSIPFHVRTRETPNVFASLILAALAAFAAYGRWMLLPR